MKRNQIALQLWTIQAAVDKDYTGAFRTIRNIGYAGVEVGNFGPLRSATEFKKLLDDTGLACVGYHILLEPLMANPGAVVDMCHTIGCKNLVVPIIEEAKRNKEGYRWLSGKLGDLSKIVNRSGISLSFHNHAEEFEKFDGVFGQDIILDPATAGTTLAELDVYWTTYGHQDPVQWINKLAGRLRLMHVKDMSKDEDRFFCEVGHGRLDMPAIIQAADRAKVEWFVVEQDATRRDCVESATMSYNYLAKLAKE